MEPIPPTPTNGEISKTTSIKIDPLVAELKDATGDGEKSSKIQTPRKSSRQNKVEVDLTKKQSTQLSNEEEASPSKTGEDV